jgi:hypothetical protein
MQGLILSNALRA